MSAERDVFGSENPFVLGVPVPGSADHGSLALAVLLDPSDLTDTDELTGPQWELLPGVYDPDGGYFVTTVALLAESGRTVALVEVPGWSTPELGSPSGPSSRLIAQQAGPGFLAACLYFDDEGVNDRGLTCDEDDELLDRPRRRGDRGHGAGRPVARRLRPRLRRADGRQLDSASHVR